jgi:hypothetical protein
MPVRQGVALILLISAASLLEPQPLRPVAWSDLPAPIQHLLDARGVREDGFDAYIERIRARTSERLREGDFDHLVYYALQSTRITSRPPIEPALSARNFVEGLASEERTRFLAEATDATDQTWLPDISRVPADARARLFALRDRVEQRDATASIRLTHFRDVLASSPPGAPRDTALLHAYMRAMRFLYQKEFVARQSKEEVATLYETRGLSSDTAVEATFGVYTALATAHGVDAAWRARRALVIGPGLDLAPRTDLIDLPEPQSYQPFLVADALLALGMADRDRLSVDAVDINPLVVDVLQRSTHPPQPQSQPIRLFLLTGIAENASTHFADDYRAYFTSLGHAIGVEEPWPFAAASANASAQRLRKALRIAPELAQHLAARVGNIVTDRSPTPSAALYDIIIVTNVFPYLNDTELLLALANIASQLAPGGFLIHNEPRPLLFSTATALGLPITQARTVLIATKTNGQHLYDAIWLHRRGSTQNLQP